MASPTLVLRMSEMNEHHVHPFFASARTHPPASLIVEQSPYRSESPTRQQEGTVGEMDTKKRKKKKKNKEKRGRKPVLAPKAQQSSITNLLPKKLDPKISEKVPSIVHHVLTQNEQSHTTDSAKRSAAPTSASATDLEVDPNKDRRKRRKTVSPSPILAPSSTQSWEAQLKNAAYGSESTSLSEGPIIPKQEPRPSTLPQTPDNLATRSDEEKTVPIAGIPQMLPVKETSIESKTPSPPKKVLKLRKDGKLVSPKAKPALEQVKPKRGRPTGKSPRKAKIVALRYGRDEGTRLRLGQKIEQVLSSPISKPQAQDITENAGTTRSTTPQPPKATHPFFLAKPTIKNDLESPSKVFKTSEPGQVNSKPSPQRPAQAPSERVVRAWPTFSSNNGQALSKFPGSKNPPWPTSEDLHVRGGFEDIPTHLPHTLLLDVFQHPQKLKATEVRLNKTVLDSCTRSVQSIRGSPSLREDGFRRMQRKLMTGLELQAAINKRLGRRPPMSPATLNHQDELPGLSVVQNPENHDLTHCFATERMYRNLPTSSSAFDHFQCEPQLWIDKYAPSCAAEVLQQGREVFLLRDWLQRLTVSAVEMGNGEAKRNGLLSRTEKKKARLKKKRKRAEQLDGFVISSDEEAKEMDELTEPDEASAPESTFAQLVKKSVVRNGDSSAFPKKPGEPKKDSHAVVISGPHGCGKTAAVHAVARELGFEVFEINPGTRRSGKDLMDKVGDMTRNHLVQRNSKPHDAEEPIAPARPPEPDEAGQNKLHAFLKPKTVGKKGSKTGLKSATATAPLETAPKPKAQKQSLILLEEVDILFEEDKHFWSTVLELILQSKRPIVMTCSDESRLPIEETTLHAIFRLRPPAEPLLADYLLLLAANEGHLLSYPDVSSLCRLKHNDLRASILELNFWCQMGVGDGKGGLEWMPIPSKTISYLTPEGQLRRVISEETYWESLSSPSLDALLPVPKCRTSTSSQPFDEFEKLEGVLNEQGFDFETAQRPSSDSKSPLKAKIDLLNLLDTVASAISAADILPHPGCDNGYYTLLDTTQPPLTDKVRNDYVTGHPLLQADPQCNWTQPAAQVAPILAHRAALLREIDSRGIFTHNTEFTDYEATRRHDLLTRPTLQATLPRAAFTQAFAPLGDSSSTPFSHNKGPSISVFEGPLAPIVEDVAPYVRSIVAYDITLEEQRLRLSNMLSEAGRNGKKPRTTRASRAALEGGRKEETRRERWFPRKTDFALVERTGGKDWPSLMRETNEGLDAGSREGKGGADGENTRRLSVTTEGSV